MFDSLAAGILRAAPSCATFGVGRTAALRAAGPPLLKYQKCTPCKSKGRIFGTPGGNRTHNGPLGGGCYIHLTTEACFPRDPRRGNTSGYVFPAIPAAGILRATPSCAAFGVGRTHNGPLGGGCYIHLTTEAHLVAKDSPKILSCPHSRNFTSRRRGTCRK